MNDLNVDLLKVVAEWYFHEETEESLKYSLMVSNRALCVQYCYIAACNF
jgi:hypothetical protein